MAGEGWGSWSLLSILSILPEPLQPPQVTTDARTMLHQTIPVFSARRLCRVTGDLSVQNTIRSQEWPSLTTFFLAIQVLLSI